MRFLLNVVCDNCESYAAFEPKRHTLKDEEKVYEDYSSLKDGIKDNKIFSVSTSPDTLHFVCKKCGHKHDLTI